MLKSFRLGDCVFTHFRQKGNHGEVEEWFKVINIYTEEEKFFTSEYKFRTSMKEEISKQHIGQYLRSAIDY
jgi:hypothetical protein